jgi:Mg-chelatase subunit ChlI
MSKITLEIPEALMHQLQNKSDSIQDILIKALEYYLEREESDITKTQTWELCGTLEVSNPDPEFIVKQNETEFYTNYAENSDLTLY